MPHEITEDHHMITAEKWLPLSAAAAFWNAAIMVVAEPDVGYKMEELMTLTIQHVNPYAVRAGYGKLGKRDVLGRILNELHASGGVRRYAKGVFAQSGRATGVLWMIKWL